MSGFDLKRIARLAKLHFKDDELKIFESQVLDILRFVDELKRLDVEGVEPTSHPLTLENVFREDKAVPSIPADKILSHAPKHRGRFFEVPKVIDEKE
jgi:aspartyl-tRNA(Asn)/glutamyl-tRNA(Gln) amidotransferase subunit C